MSKITIEMLAVKAGYEIVSMKRAKGDTPRQVTLEKDGLQVTVNDALIDDVAKLVGEPLQFPGEGKAA